MDLDDREMDADGMDIIQNIVTCQVLVAFL
jgi:hypothetical protein